jgi:hypothetical protein
MMPQWRSAPVEHGQIDRDRQQEAAQYDALLQPPSRPR